jgi:hypothetical protein
MSLANKQRVGIPEYLLPQKTNSNKHMQTQWQQMKSPIEPSDYSQILGKAIKRL